MKQIKLAIDAFKLAYLSKKEFSVADVIELADITDTSLNRRLVLECLQEDKDLRIASYDEYGRPRFTRCC